MSSELPDGCSARTKLSSEIAEALVYTLFHISDYLLFSSFLNFHDPLADSIHNGLVTPLPGPLVLGIGNRRRRPGQTYHPEVTLAVASTTGVSRWMSAAERKRRAVFRLALIHLLCLFDGQSVFAGIAGAEINAVLVLRVQTKGGFAARLETGGQFLPLAFPVGVRTVRQLRKRRSQPRLLTLGFCCSLRSDIWVILFPHISPRLALTESGCLSVRSGTAVSAENAMVTAAAGDAVIPCLDTAGVLGHLGSPLHRSMKYMPRAASCRPRSSAYSPRLRDHRPACPALINCIRELPSPCREILFVHPHSKMSISDKVECVLVLRNAGSAGITVRIRYDSRFRVNE